MLSPLVECIEEGVALLNDSVDGLVSRASG
jgi:hypothetical protein